MSIRKYIPNTITSLNCFSGILGVLAAFNAQYDLVLLFVLLAAFFDFCDGFAARLLKAYSPMGKELDSLSDMISFGFLPGMVAYKLLTPLATQAPLWLGALGPHLPLLGFLITVFSGLRLAKFNVDERQTSSFIGLATPANALLWVGLAYSHEAWAMAHPYIVLIGVLVMSGLIVSEIPMFALKVKNVSWKENKIRYIFLIGALIIIVLTQLNALLYIILWYLLVNLIQLIINPKASPLKN